MKAKLVFTAPPPISTTRIPNLSKPTSVFASHGGKNRGFLPLNLKSLHGTALRSVQASAASVGYLTSNPFAHCLDLTSFFRLNGFLEEF